MPFIWNTNPNIPTAVPPLVIGPNEITFKVHVVANTVNAGGEVLYNTPNAGYDVIYDLPSLNVRNLQVTFLNASHATINTATISTASINRASINTANITNATIQYGFMGSNPGSNLEIATKGYVDAAAANVPAGGSDLEGLIDAAGDLLVGISANNLARLPVGSNGQILSADSTTATGLRWKTISGLTSFAGLYIGTHPTPSLKVSQVLLRHADGIVMDDGASISQWNNLVADIRLSGAGGLDVGVESPSHWYEVHAIRKTEDGTKALILHRAPETKLDQSLTATTDSARDVRKASGGNSKLDQSFIPANTGPLTSVEVEVSRTGSPTGLIWVTVESDDANNIGFPSGNVLATSRVMDVARLPTDKARMRFLFDTNTSVTLGETYHVIYQGNYTLSDTNYTTIWGILAGGYADGRANEFRIAFSDWKRCTDSGGPADLWFKTFVQQTPTTAVTMPAGYDQRCLVSYVYNDSASNFKGYFQLNHTMTMGVSAPWRAFDPVTALLETVDLEPFVPPVTAVVQFTAAQIGRGNTIYIGGVSSTDLPTGNGTSDGAMSANLVISSLTPGLSPGAFGEIVVENQLILTRLKNTNCRLYISLIRF